jgi:hypothetical protein
MWKDKLLVSAITVKIITNLYAIIFLGNRKPDMAPDMFFFVYIVVTLSAYGTLVNFAIQYQRKEKPSFRQ